MQLPTELIKIFHLHSQGYFCREKNAKTLVVQFFNVKKFQTWMSYIELV